MLTIVLDFLLVAFSCFGYLLKPHLSRALSGRAGARLRRSWRRARALFVGLVRRPLNCWRRWRLRHLSGHEVGLLRLGREIERFGETLNANGNHDEQEDQEEDEEGPREEAVPDRSVNGTARGGVGAPAGPNPRAKINNDRETTRQSPSKTLEASPALILEAASAYYSNKLSPPSDDSSSVGAKRAAPAAETGPLEFYFVARDNPIVCSINWMNSDLICFGREARAGNKNCSLSSVAGLADELGQGPKGGVGAGEKGGDLAGTSVGHAPIDQREGKLRPAPKQANKTSVIGGASPREGHASDTEGDADVTEPEQIVDQAGGADLARGEIRPGDAAAAARSSGGAQDATGEAGRKNKNKEEDIEEDKNNNNNNKGPHQTRNRHHNGNSSRGKYLNETHNNSKRVLSRASDNNHGDATKGGRRGSRDQVDDEAGSSSGKPDDGPGRQQQRQKHGRGAPIETAATLAGGGRGGVGGSLVSVRRIWSSQCNGTTKRELILIQQQLAPSGRSPVKDPLPATISRTFCLAELYSHAQLLRFDARSSLIFYFIQLYSNELAPLFGLISRLLELAGLIEPCGYCCRRLSQRKTGTRSSGNSGTRSGNTDDGHHDEDERYWLELVGWELGVDSRKSADENDADKLLARQLAGQQPQATSGRLIDRYALVLMIVAHLERERSSSANKTLASAAAKSNEQIRLASSLASFFECYSSCVKMADRDGGRQAAPLVLVHSREAAKSGPKAASNKHAKMEIEFVAGTSNAAAAAPFVHLVADRTRPTLVVLDPIEFRLNNSLGPNCLEPGNKLELAPAEWATFNLTSRLEVWSDICQLFADCHALITRPPNPTEAQVGAGTISDHDDDGSRETNARASTLNELFELAERSRSKQRHGRDLSEQIEQIWSPKQGQQHQTGIFSYHCSDDSTGGAAANRADGNQSGSLIRRSLSKLNKLRQNKLIKSLFYLFLFVAFRFAVLSFLQGLQRDLMYEARDDFIALKRMIFPGGIKMVDDGDDDDQDGISILMRDEQKEARRAEANRRREAAAAAESNRNMNPLSTNDDQGHEGASAEAEEVNKVMEALLTGLFSQAFGNAGDGEMANMDPQKLAEMMKMLTAPEGNGGGGGGDDEDQGDQDDVQFDEQEFAKMLEEMQLLTGGGGEGGGLKLNMAGLAELMGDGAADDESGGVFQSEQMSNIDSDYDEEDDDFAEQFDGGDDGHEDDDDRSGMTEQTPTGTSDEL